MENGLKSGVLSNRDRFFELLTPIFEKSKYFMIKKTMEKKYKEKKIEVLYKGTNEHFCHIWCHSRNNRLDLLLPNVKVPAIAKEYELETNCKTVLKQQKLEGMLATSFQEMDESVLLGICKYIAGNSL